MHQPQPQSYAFSALIHDIETGGIKIPQFQREFVWTRNKSAQLLDSIVKGYPIGTFILWKTKEALRSVRNVGHFNLPATVEGDATQYVLDGQQRITSLFASIRGEKLGQEKSGDFSEIYVDLDASIDEPIVLTDLKENATSNLLPLTSLLEAKVATIAQLDAKYHQKVQDYRDQFRNYQFSAIVIQNVGIETATDVFTRINTSGKDLSIFEIMVAKTYSDKRNFDLAERYDDLISSLRKVGYGSVPPATILQIVSSIICDDCSAKTILNLRRDDFIDSWPAAIDALNATIDYLRSSYRILVSDLLPYNSLLVFLTYYFHKHPAKPDAESARLLQDLFWRVSLGSRYTSAVEAKLAQDIKRINQIIAGEHPSYDWPVDTSSSFIGDSGYFNAGRSYIKALLCIYAYQQPKSFDDNAIVNLQNDWLKRANSKNYHHFFPKAVLKRGGWDDDWINNIVNITLVDDRLNKAVIGSKKPSVYLKAFMRNNQDLAETMLRSHLIDIENDGCLEDDYEKFYYARLKRLAAQVKKRILPQPIDARQQPPIEDDPTEDEASIREANNHLGTRDEFDIEEGSS